MAEHSEGGRDRREVVLARARDALRREPEFVARAPGRVNLIGEHTDYNGFPVMPMAIDRDIAIAGVARSDGEVHLLNRGRFATRSFALGDTIAPFPAGDWGNYVKAAAQGLGRHLDGGLRRGADLYVDGDVPDGAGLSSSSALVVASALALLAANEVDVPHADLAELLPRAEQYVGTLSGGMDQTISLLGLAGHALRIDFRPLRWRPVPLPTESCFVVAHSLVHADKAGGARRAYNTRVAECRLAAWAAARLLRGESDSAAPLLGDLPKLLGMPTASVAAAVESVLPAAEVTLEQLGSLTGAPGSAIRAAVDLPADVENRFALAARARHVLTEASRVDLAEAALHAGDAEACAAAMIGSRAGCRDGYEISCAALEALGTTALRMGALGARLTGAGFGGCIVALVPTSTATDFVAELDETFYAPRERAGAELDHLRFVLQPSGGADVTRR